MSAFRPKVKFLGKDCMKHVRAAYELRALYRMIANGSTEQHAYQVLTAKRARREAKRKEADNA